MEKKAGKAKEPKDQDRIFQRITHFFMEPRNLKKRSQLL
jgi:hypothetical protein